MISDYDVSLFRRLLSRGASVTPLGAGVYLVDALEFGGSEDVRLLRRFLEMSRSKGTDSIKVVVGGEFDTWRVSVKE